MPLTLLSCLQPLYCLDDAIREMNWGSSPETRCKYVHVRSDAASDHHPWRSQNVLNMFRQDNGYKQGNYNKDWNGREDNEHLADIMKTLNADSRTFKDDVYAALAQSYAA